LAVNISFGAIETQPGAPIIRIFFPTEFDHVSGALVSKIHNKFGWFRGTAYTGYTNVRTNKWLTLYIEWAALNKKTASDITFTSARNYAISEGWGDSEFLQTVWTVYWNAFRQLYEENIIPDNIWNPSGHIDKSPESIIEKGSEELVKAIRAAAKGSGINLKIFGYSAGMVALLGIGGYVAFKSGVVKKILPKKK